MDSTRPGPKPGSAFCEARAAKARPKPGLSGQARAGTSLTVVNNSAMLKVQADHNGGTACLLVSSQSDGITTTNLKMRDYQVDTRNRTQLSMSHGHFVTKA
jgi:hypothetical protein